jgi:hypothetical protein
MGFKTFTPSVLTSADVNDYLMKQAVITCTSSSRPSSPVEGMTIYETDTDCYVTYSGSAWVHDLGGTWRSYTPTFGSVTLGNGTVVGRYSVIGKTVSGVAELRAGSTTTYAAGNITVSLPRSTAAWYGGSTPVGGGGAVHNGSGPTRRIVIPIWNNASSLVMALETTSGFVTTSTPFTFGTSANIIVQFTYEAA